MRAKCRGVAAALAVGLLCFTLAGHATAAASSPGGDEAIAAPPQSGEEAKVMQPPPPGGEGEMMQPPPEREGGRHKGKGLGRDLEKLDLTAEQQAKLKEQRKEQKDVMKLVRKSLKAVHEELRAEIDKEKSDPAKIEKFTKELKRLEAQRVDWEVKGILRMKEVLTPEQFKKLGAMKEERKGDRHEWRDEGRGDGRGRGHRRGRDDDAAAVDEHKACVSTPAAQSAPGAPATEAR